MATEFKRGQKGPLSSVTNGTDLYVGVMVTPSEGWDISCFGLDAAEQLSDDRYFVFFNQPKSPEDSIQLLGAQSGDTDSFRVTLDLVPEAISKLVFCATYDGDGSASSIAQGYLRVVAGGEEVWRYPFTGADFTTERAIMIASLYRKGEWRVSADGQGFAGGLADLLKAFGGEVLDEPEPEPAPAAPGFAPPAGPAPGFAPPPAAAPAPGFAPPPSAPAAPTAPPPPAAPAAPPPPAAPAAPSPPAAPPPPAPPPPAPPAPAPAMAAPTAGVAHTDLPSQARPTPPGSMQSLEAYKEQPTQGRWSKQNSKLVKVTLGEEAFARRGSMVAYQGDIEFGFKGPGGLKTFFEGKMTGQALSLMVCKGSGEVFLAENATDLHVVDLAGRTLCVMAKNILAFDATVQVQIQRLESAGLPGGGLYFLQLSGQGSVVVMTRGTPMSLPVVGPTHADVNAAVAWSAGMRVSVTSQVRVVRTVYAGVSGEANNLQFMAMDGEHFVVVQPFEV